MNRVGEYIRFAVWFSGVGYIALWPLTAPDDGVAALPLSPGLHLAGMMSSACVLICLVLRPLQRWRRKGRLRKASAGTAKSGIARLRLVKRRSPAPQPRRFVRKRAHFGLRGAPH